MKRLATLLAIAIMTLTAYAQSKGKPVGGHNSVDLGLSVNWATCNLGANAPSAYGKYYAWGETETKATYDSNNYRYARGFYGSITDVATKQWGSVWRMPTTKEMRELVTKCTWKWTKVGKVSGYMVTGPNGNTIFLPATGRIIGKVNNTKSKNGYYWTSGCFENGNSAYALTITPESKSVPSDPIKGFHGLSIRPVTSQK